MEARSSTSPDNLIDELRYQLSAAENQIAALQQEKIQMTTDFDFKRTKIKELYYAKENTIREQDMKLLLAAQHVSKLESTISSLQEEIDNVKMIASVSENTKAEAVEDLNKHHHEEVESLRCVLQDSMEEQRRELIVQFEQERRHWGQERARLEGELEEMNDMLSEAQFLEPARDKNRALKDGELDLGMKKAQVEADQLKAVVVPLENEILELKEKLRLTEENLGVEKRKTEHASKKKDEIQDNLQSKEPLQNGIDTRSHRKNVVTGTPTSRPYDSTDDESFEPFQSYVDNNDRTPPPIGDVTTPITEFQDSISVTSVSSLPGSSQTTQEDPVKAPRVLSAPDLNSMGKDDETPKRTKESRAWDEVPAPETDNSSSSSETKSDYLLQIDALQRECAEFREKTSKLQKQVEKEKRMRIDVEESVTHASEEAQKQIKLLSEKLSDLEAKLVEEKSWRRQKETEDDKRLAHLQKDREHIYKQLMQMKSENDFVRASYQKHRSNLAHSAVSPHNLEEFKVELHRCRESLVAAQVEKSHLESRLQSQLSFLQDRLNAEMVAKEQMEITFQMELEDARKQLNSLHDLRQKLDEEMAEKLDLQSRFDKDQISIESIRAKSKEIIRGLKEKLNNETTSKEDLEVKLSATKNQVRSLQESLETSEHVQQDFVRLSQSLQMKLEEIRTKEEMSKNSSASSHQESHPNHHPPPQQSPG